MLQQTQVKTVIPYFHKFVKKFKTIDALSKSNEKEILKMWEGLGYYRRARNLLECAKILVKKHKSRLPRSIVEIKKLPGVGDYTANALLGLVHNEPRIAIDGNVKRLFSTVKEINNPKFYRLIYEFYKLTQIPMVINTSLNYKGDPICCSIEDIIKTFYLSGLDSIIINNYLIEKK